jgi:glutamate-5-semialdehyde dehydrogenase
MESILEQDLDALIVDLAKQARRASFTLGNLPAEKKNAILLRIADSCLDQKTKIQEANACDLEAGRSAGLSSAMLDRLTLTDDRIQQMAEGLRQVASLPDPVGEEVEHLQNPRGLDIRKVRVPIGVVAIIYESRPNVTIDCAALCLKSGNAAILRGGKEAFYSNQALAAIISEALGVEGVDPACVTLIPTVDRQALNTLLKQDRYVHCVIPRGGEGLIRFVVENSSIPVIKHYKGVCNLYIDAAADADKAVAIALNGKCQRPGVCNALENLWIHQSVLNTLGVKIGEALHQAGVELRTDSRAYNAFSASGIPSIPANEEDFFEEYLNLTLSVGVVDDLDRAIASIHHFGSGHSDAIITEDADIARRFLKEVDSATVYWNASTRFTDGFEFGLGAEIGISTDRLHARGPMGLRELCSYKYLIFGKGEIR